MAASRMQLAMRMSRAIAGLDDIVHDIDEDIVDIGLNGDNEDGGEDTATGRRDRGGQKQQDPQGRGQRMIWYFGQRSQIFGWRSSVAPVIEDPFS